MKILFLEEKQSDLKLLESHLEDAFKNFESRVARTKKDFTRLVKSFLPDVIIAGSTLSKNGIIEALDYLKEHEPGVAFVFITKDKRSDLSKILIKKGADNFILKTDLHHLHAIVHNALKKKNAEKKKKKSNMTRKPNDEKLHAHYTEVECIFQIGLKGEFIEMNPAALELTESSSEIKLGKSKLWDFIDKNEIKKLKAFHQSIFNGNEKKFTFHFIGHKGTSHIIAMRAVPLRDLKNEVTSALLVGRDITGKTNTAETFKKTAEKETLQGKKKARME